MKSTRATVSSFPHVDAAHQYARSVVSGAVPACKWVRLACQRHLDDLKRKEWPYRFSKLKAQKKCDFMELSPHTKGKWAAKAETFHLSDWQTFVVCSLFGWVHKKTGLRRFREAYIEVPRKSGKSYLAANIGLALFADDNEFGAEVFSGATTEKQAWEIFRPAQLIAKRSPWLCEEYGITVSASNLAILNNGSRFEPLIGSPGDGASPSCALIDEYHEHKSDTLYETMVTGMGAREQPLVFIVTTAGSNLAGPCYMKRIEICKILERVEEDETTFGLIFTIDEDDDWTSEESLRKANPNYGISVSAEYLLERQRAAMRSARKQNSFKTKHLNLWVGAFSAWMDMLRWRQQPQPKEWKDLLGRRCFVGIDLSSKIDVTAMTFLFPPSHDDPLWHLHCKFYLPEEIIEEEDNTNVSHYDTWAKMGFLTLTEGTSVDYDVIKDDLIAAAREVEIVRVGYDPWNSTGLINPLQKEEAFTVRSVRGKDEHKLIEIPQNAKYFSEPMKEIETFVRKKIFAHGDNPVLTWMFSNVVAKEDRNENIYPIKEAPENKIDGVVSTIMAVYLALNDTGQRRSKYEEQDLISI